MTVPFGGDVANPMVQTESGPGKGGYILGTILIIIGVVGGIAWGVVNAVDFSNSIDDFERTPTDEIDTIELDAGDYVIYGERGGGADNGVTAVLADVRMRPAGEGNDELELEPYEAEFSYDIGNRAGRAQFTVDIPEDGEYDIQATGIPGGATTVAVGPSVAGKLVSAIVGGLAIAGVGVILGVILLIVTGSRRRKFRQRNWTGGWTGPGGGGSQGNWNPQPGGFGTPPAPGGAWSPPAPPSGFPQGGSYPPPPG